MARLKITRENAVCRYINYTSRLKELLYRLNGRLTEDQLIEAISKRIKLNPNLRLEHSSLEVGKINYSANMAKKYLTEVRSRVKRKQNKKK